MIKLLESPLAIIVVVILAAIVIGMFGVVYAILKFQSGISEKNIEAAGRHAEAAERYGGLYVKLDAGLTLSNEVQRRLSEEVHLLSSGLQQALNTQQTANREIMLSVQRMSEAIRQSMGAVQRTSEAVQRTSDAVIQQLPQGSPPPEGGTGR